MNELMGCSSLKVSFKSADDPPNDYFPSLAHNVHIQACYLLIFVKGGCHYCLSMDMKMKIHTPYQPSLSFCPGNSQSLEFSTSINLSISRLVSFSNFSFRYFIGTMQKCNKLRSWKIQDVNLPIEPVVSIAREREWIITAEVIASLGIL